MPVIDLANDGSTAEIRMGRSAFPFVNSFGWGDGLEKEMVRRIGSQAIDAWTPGQYKTDDAKGSMETAVFKEVCKLLPRNGFGNHSFPIHAQEIHPEIGPSEYHLQRCYFTNLAASIEASNKATVIEVTFKVTQVYWNGKTINRRGGSLDASPLRL
jgi:hypothetical protein